MLEGLFNTLDIDMVKVTRVLLLLGCANFAPILARIIFKERFATPVDLGKDFIDHRPLFGPHKTIRGITASLLFSGAAAPVLGFNAALGLKVSLVSMLSDLGSSFIKRRIGLKSGARATFVDQVPEALIPIMIFRKVLNLDWQEIFATTMAFFLLEVLLSPLLYLLKVRRRPY